MDRTPFLRADALTARHGFFTRQGGVSAGVYASLQAGFGAKSDPRENVDENRRRIMAALDLGAAALVAPRQIHSAEARIVLAPFGPDETPKVDGLATRQPGVALAALAADCMPILLEDAAAGVVGACHAGWRGALDGVVEATLAQMVALGAQAARIRGAIGPCISQAAYEVGPEFVARFVEQSPETARFFAAPASARPEDRRRFDLAGYLVEGRLAQGPWAAVRLQRLNRCTYGEPDLFYSHRRATHAGEDDYGRLIAVIAPVWP